VCCGSCKVARSDSFPARMAQSKRRPNKEALHSLGLVLHVLVVSVHYRNCLGFLVLLFGFNVLSSRTVSSLEITQSPGL